MHQPVLDQIEAISYATSVHRMRDYVEMHALELQNPDNQHIARVVEGDGAEACDKCACLLAEMLGITRKENKVALCCIRC